MILPGREAPDNLFKLIPLRRDMFSPGDKIMVKASGKVYEVSKVEPGAWSGRMMVRVLDNNVPKWYFEGEVKPA